MRSCDFHSDATELGNEEPPVSIRGEMFQESFLRDDLVMVVDFDPPMELMVAEEKEEGSLGVSVGGAVESAIAVTESLCLPEDELEKLADQNTTTSGWS